MGRGATLCRNRNCVRTTVLVCEQNERAKVIQYGMNIYDKYPFPAVSSRCVGYRGFWILLTFSYHFKTPTEEKYFLSFMASNQKFTSCTNKARIFRFCKVMTTRSFPETYPYSIRKAFYKNTYESAASCFRWLFLLCPQKGGKRNNNAWLGCSVTRVRLIKNVREMNKEKRHL